MAENPWKVKTIKEFWFLNCPECEFKVKEEKSFHDHAVMMHPLSTILFENSSENDQIQLEQNNSDKVDKIIEEIADQFVKNYLATQEIQENATNKELHHNDDVVIVATLSKRENALRKMLKLSVKTLETCSRG